MQDGSVHDGAGAALHWRRAGYAVGFLSGRDSAGGQARLRSQVELSCTWARAASSTCSTTSAPGGACGTRRSGHGRRPPRPPLALRRVGVLITAPRRALELFEHCRHVTRALRLGRRAVREVVELLLEAKGRFAEVLARCGMKASEPDCCAAC
ncbi:MAG: hypothetical protein R3F30_05555 [Planctomycetota bacterium]